MCPSKPKAPPPPPPPPAAPPPPAETATGFSSAGRRASTAESASNIRRRGIEDLRVGLNVPGGKPGGLGVNVP